MKKAAFRSVITFFIGCILPQIHRAFARPIVRINPFHYGVDRDGKELIIFLQWYVKDIGEALSFTAMMMTICFILKPIEKHLKEAKWVGHNSMMIFVKMWYRVFTVVIVISILDLIHYLLSYRHSEWFFLISNGIFLFFTVYYIYKAYRK